VLTRLSKLSRDCAVVGRESKTSSRCSIVSLLHMPFQRTTFFSSSTKAMMIRGCYSSRRNLLLPQSVIYLNSDILSRDGISFSINSLLGSLTGEYFSAHLKLCYGWMSFQDTKYRECAK